MFRCLANGGLHVGESFIFRQEERFEEQICLDSCPGSMRPGCCSGKIREGKTLIDAFRPDKIVGGLKTDRSEEGRFVRSVIDGFNE